MVNSRKISRRLLLGGIGASGLALLGSDAFARALTESGNEEDRESFAYPPLPRPETLDVIANLGDADTQITLMTLQGVLAQRRPRLYLNPGRGYAQWLDELDRLHIELNEQSDPWALMRRYAEELAGAVLYTSGDQDSVNAATTLSGVLRAVAISRSNSRFAEQAGLSVLADTTGVSPTWAFDRYWSRLRHDIVIEQRGSNPRLRDYGTALRSLTFFTGNNADRARIAAAAPHGSIFLGWGDASRGENVFVGANSQAGHATIPSDHSYNITSLSGVRQPLRQHEGATPAGQGERKHTVTFVMTDGDNVQWMMNDFSTSTRWFGNPQRGTVPIGWTTSPSLPRLASPVLSWLYAHASPGTDEFVAGPSGLGYSYPSMMPNRSTFAAASAAAMREADLHLLTIIDFGGFTEAVLDPFLTQPQIEGVIYWEYSRYDQQQGRILWVKGKPAVSARYLLWTPQFNNPAALADRLNQMPADPTAVDGYSLVAVHSWSEGFPGLLATVARLQPQVEVVPPSVFFARLRRHRPGA